MAWHHTSGEDLVNFRFLLSHFRISQNSQLQKQEQHRENIDYFTCESQRQKFMVKHTEDDRGMGVFARKKIPNASYIGEYKGELINTAELNRRIKIRGDYIHYIFQLSAGKFVDANVGGDFTSKINHARNPNVIAYSDKVGQKVDLYTLKTIAKGEQLLLNYGSEWFKDNEITELDPSGAPY